MNESNKIVYNFYFESPVYSPCPHALWTIWCPHANNPDECLKCPVYRDRERGTAIYVFPRDTDMKIEPIHDGSLYIEGLGAVNRA